MMNNNDSMNTENSNKWLIILALFLPVLASILIFNLGAVLWYEFSDVSQTLVHNKQISPLQIGAVSSVDVVISEITMFILRVVIAASFIGFVMASIFNHFISRHIPEVDAYSDSAVLNQVESIDDEGILQTIIKSSRSVSNDYILINH